MPSRPQHEGLPARRRQRLVTAEELAARVGMHPDVIVHLVALGVIDPVDPGAEPGRYLFRREVTLRIGRALRLRRAFGGSYNSVGLTLELLDRIERLERRLLELGDDPRRLG